MRRMPIASAAAVLVLAVCTGSRPNVAVQFTGPEPASNSTTQPTPCALAPAGDVIVRVVVPDLPAFAVRMGGVDQVHCETVFDEIARTTTGAAGYCREVAPMADNEGYDSDSTPAPPLRNVRVSAGAGCNQWADGRPEPPTATVADLIAGRTTSSDVYGGYQTDSSGNSSTTSPKASAVARSLANDSCWCSLPMA